MDMTTRRRFLASTPLVNSSLALSPAEAARLQSESLRRTTAKAILTVNGLYK
jgi:hypothetical protein